MAPGGQRSSGHPAPEARVDGDVRCRGQPCESPHPWAAVWACSRPHHRIGLPYAAPPGRGQALVGPHCRGRTAAVRAFRAAARHAILGFMGPVEHAVRGSVQPGLQLATPGQEKPFEVAECNRGHLVLLLGAGKWRTAIPWEALEVVPDLLRGRGWVSTTGSYSTDKDPSSLSGWLKQYVSRETANWVAVVLERASILELDRGRPLRARLRHGF